MLIPNVLYTLQMRFSLNASSVRELSVEEVMQVSGGGLLDAILPPVAGSVSSVLGQVANPVVGAVGELVPVVTNLPGGIL